MDMHTTPRQWLGVLVFLLVTAGIAPLLAQGWWLVAAAFGDSGAVTGIVGRSYGTWSYQATQLSGGAVDVYVQYDDTSVAALQAFATANQEIAQQLAAQGGQAAVRITFRTYMDPDRFRAWVQTNGLQVGDSTLAAVNGQAGTLGISAQGADMLPQAEIDQYVAELQRPLRGGAPRPPPLGALGVYETTGTIAAATLPALSRDPLVFVADLTANLVQRDLRAKGMFAPAQGQFGESPLWGPMLRFGLANFR